MKKYLFVDDDQCIGVEIWVNAESEKEARQKAWAMLTDEEKDACGSFDCVDEVQA